MCMYVCFIQVLLGRCELLSLVMVDHILGSKAMELRPPHKPLLLLPRDLTQTPSPARYIHIKPAAHTCTHSVTPSTFCHRHTHAYVVRPLSFYPTVYSIFSPFFIFFIQTLTFTELCSLWYFIALLKVTVPVMCSGLCKLGHALESPVSEVHAPWRNNRYANPVEI